jgi:hypothetical protein
MRDPFYLPVPPIFRLVRHDPEGDILADFLSYRDKLSPSDDFPASRILHDVNSRKHPHESLSQLIAACEREGRPQACLFLGRTYEFGAYNETQAAACYERVNDTSALSPLSLFHRHSSQRPASSSRRTAA